MSELEPCPFCGGEADYHIHERIGVECLACGAGFATVFGSREEAAEAWNRRAEAEQLRELVRDYEELAAALCDARECDGCPFDSERTICEHMRLIARVGELGVDA